MPDSLKTDSTEARPLPKWLTDQRDGLNAYQPVQREMKSDHSLHFSFLATILIAVLAVLLLTVYFRRKKRV